MQITRENLVNIVNACADEAGLDDNDRRRIVKGIQPGKTLMVGVFRDLSDDAPPEQCGCPVSLAGMYDDPRIGGGNVDTTIEPLWKFIRAFDRTMQAKYLKATGGMMEII